MPIQPFFFLFWSTVISEKCVVTPVFFSISIAPDMIFLSQIVIIWEKILPISVHRP